MRQHHFSILIFILLLSSGFDSGAQASLSPSAEAYYPFLKWLASPGLEGRETGTPGEARAADSIAIEMQHVGLAPWNRSVTGNSESLFGYFQPVTIHRFSPCEAVITFSSKEKSPSVSLVQGRDFTADYALTSLDLSCHLVFAGYGIHSESSSWNDYQGLNVNGKVVVIREGYPAQTGHNKDSNKALTELKSNDGFDLNARSREAYSRGALALLVIPEGFDPKAAYQPGKNDSHESPYQDAQYQLPEVQLPGQAPMLLLTYSGARSLLNNLAVGKGKPETGQSLLSRSRVTGKQIKLHLEVRKDTLSCKNVAGYMAGMDTSRTIVIGAHYDHLGKRGEVIYPGADDNASGVAGMLALASAWSGNGTKPPCNLVFAAWTAEEKGHHGSRAFVTSLADPGKVQLYINLDMISRSESADSTRSKLSIGTRTADEYLRVTAQRCNADLLRPFQLDLWDVTGHHGSDYASFTAAGIPILTFNTGLHEDYHTPRDVPEAVDLLKMNRVIRLVDLLLKELANRKL